MAIDTRNKRSSTIQVAEPWRIIMPNPFGPIDAAGREQLGWCYKGIAAAAPAIDPIVASLQSVIILKRQREVSVHLNPRTVNIPKEER